MSDQPQINYDSLQQLGKSGTEFLGLETFPAPVNGINVELTNLGEFTALCPKTGQPDFYDLRIVYEATDKCVESKSLKLYLGTFREIGAFAESLAAQILHDVVQACQPEFCQVSLTMKPRGGIGLTATADYSSFDDDFDDEDDL